MPQPFQLKAEQGSVLAGVLALSMAMTAIAGGYVLIAGGTSGRSTDAGDDLRLHYAAEAGEQLGSRWLKTYLPKYYSRWESPPTVFNDPIWNAYPEIPISPSGFRILGCDVVIKAVPSMGPPTNGQYGNFQIHTEATLGAHRETLIIDWGVNSANPGTAPLKSKPFNNYWRETYKPGKP